MDTLKKVAVVAIIILSLFIFVKMFNKIELEQRIDVARKERLAQIDQTKKELREDIDRMQRDLITFQNVNERVVSSQIKRIENLESSKNGVVDGFDVRKVLENNLSYLEGRINNLAARVDKDYNELNGRLNLLEARIKQYEDREGKLSISSKQRVLISNTNVNTINNDNKQ